MTTVEVGDTKSTTPHSQVDRILDLHRRHTTTLAEQELMVSVDSYTAPEVYAAEIEQLFERHPLPVAHISQLANPGSYATIDVTDRPVVVVRTHRGELSAFLNVCRHRGARLVDDRYGAVRNCFTCPYHGWSYELDGRLKGIPDRVQSFPNLDPASRGLRPVAVEVAAGFAWVRLQDGLTGDPIASARREPELASDDFVVYSETTQRRQFNWKVGVEGFLENYHFSYLHRNSTDSIFLHNLALVDQRGLHVRAVAPKRSILTLENKPSDNWELAPHATVLHLVFPSTCIFVEKDHLSVVQLLPVSVTSTDVIITHVVRHDKLSLRRHWDKNIEIFMSAVDEDLDVCESIQSGLRSRANEELVFGRCESGLQLFRRSIDIAMRRP